MGSDDLSGELAALADSLDFGEYEIEAYLAVLRHGKLTAAEISEATDIPQPRVYDTVRSLADDGLVELRDSRPLEVLAVDPEEAFGELQTSLSTLVEHLEQRYSAPSREGEAVSLVTSRRTILRYLEDVITSAEFELVVSLTPDLLARFEDELAARREAGVTVDLLLSPSREVPDPESFEYTRVATVTHARRGVTTPVVAVADGTYAVYTTRTALARDDEYGVVLNRSELGFLVLGFLNTVVWPSATTLVEGDRDPTFPRRYATIRRCVADLQASEGPFYASVRGRDVQSGEYRTVAGDVVDIGMGTNRETAAITLAVDGDHVAVGGQAAALEDIEAHEIVVGREGASDLDALEP